ncbi:hypothetical protein [Mucilaginibacter polytrichastri]|uniref:Uncharacterized protein n=1 Tax=Mucilaginibacter polytrichastri TaxID=1302689 RepID=A0A1Q6A147_9SPHI|nr:hypothetical protein [Mucilaginibacter polytrichastri]OKS87718.1 hypothetical protein RG47T_3180 [Mucilaginibacter polytrichastri]SFT20007.1 hypothetical protein SAMN04487890_11642 [Mucilaginibacter polytrichastri]
MKNSICVLCFVILLIYLIGCASHNDIHLEKTFETSAYLKCDKVFAVNRDSIVQLNEILIQTGTLDTLEDQVTRASVIHVQGKELILDLVKEHKSGDSHQELYQGKGYKLALNYQSKNTGYKGECQVWHGKLHSCIKVEGIRNNL